MPPREAFPIHPTIPPPPAATTPPGPRALLSAFPIAHAR
jgi:hypothetical protein